MPEEKTRTLSYRRAIFLAPEADKTLADYLTKAKKKIPGLIKFTYDSGLVLEERHHRHKPEVGHFLHIVAYTPGEQASIVPHIPGDLCTAPPPEEADFLDGDIMVLIAGNHVTICANSLHEKKVERFLDKYFEVAAIESVSRHFNLSKVANINKIKMIEKQGVKEISLDASLFDASIQYSERTTIRKKLGGALLDEVKALFRKDDGTSDIQESENLTAHLILKYDGRRKDIAVGRQRLEDISKKIVEEEEEEGFTIKTVSGETLRGNDIALRKSVKIDKFGKSVWYDQTWRELEAYYRELFHSGLLDQ